jgi:signal transduction histidine kinase
MVFLPFFSPSFHNAVDLARASGVIAYIVALASSLLLYVHWRLSGGGAAAWLVAGLTGLSIQGLAMAGLVAADPERVNSRPGLVLLSQAAIAIGVIAVVWAAGRLRFRFDPLTAGISAGLSLFALRFLLLSLAHPLSLGQRTIDLLSAVVLALDIAVFAAVLAFGPGPRWIRAWLGVALAILGGGHISAYPSPEGIGLSATTIAMNLIGSTILCSLALATLRLSIRDNRKAMAFLRHQLMSVEAGMRADRAGLHEIRATLAGISSAAHLVQQDSAVAPARREQIQQMMDSEISRLERLMNDRHIDAPGVVDLDTTIEPIVLRQRARGYPIGWEPSGMRAMARADDVAEVVNVLLENAFRHAPNAQAWIDVRSAGDNIEVAVSDSGPGVSTELRDRIFDWGQSGPDSPGEGIGLHVARQLSTELGGHLRLVESISAGACFVLSLPSDQELS